MYHYSESCFLPSVNETHWVLDLAGSAMTDFLFIIFMDRISSCSQKAANLQFGQCDFQISTHDSQLDNAVVHSPVWGGVLAFKMLVVTKNKIMMLKTLKLFQMTYLCRCGYVSERGSDLFLSQSDKADEPRREKSC